jgi:membrane-bound lytic murein transglycosylase D
LASTAKAKPEEAVTKLAEEAKETAPVQHNTEKKAVTDKNRMVKTDQGEYVYYKVKKGDNFWSIAKKFPGVSNHDIMRLNNIRAANSLRVGQVLKIMPKA